MITDADVTKLKKAFATKEELNSKFDALDNKINKVDKKIDDKIDSLSEVMTKEFQTVIEMIGDMIARFDRQDEQIKEQSSTLDDHERRLDKVEDKVFTA
ncbi:hypothetical protein A2966_03115 [Candidatus Roizmanbacteria bacterium RIFCSPLOWO2_01_FULL_41_22]|uniref:Uncharacterized protein n=1 Tax=Candidatus Roizmanbacteria bacterium RIFCSPLOWO2_01_FULL_41_22 TaxID=1802067 RepID=A0A1F7J750_9BACT|nr:MAG: hypothetical protein A2966_03115 [Candidatus Roizmanbacteria bacterium RIFCSPLOWO2_01_FULL_41_22]